MVAIIPNEIRNSRFRRNRAAANSLRVQTDGCDPVSGLNKSHLIGSGTPDFLNPFITVLGLPDGHFAHPVPGQWRGLVKTLPSLKDALSCGKKKRLKGSKFQRNAAYCVSLALKVLVKDLEPEKNSCRLGPVSPIERTVMDSFGKRGLK
jgi:hypothetical protein